MFGKKKPTDSEWGYVDNEVKPEYRGRYTKARCLEFKCDCRDYKSLRGTGQCVYCPHDRSQHQTPKKLEDPKRKKEEKHVEVIKDKEPPKKSDFVPTPPVRANEKSRRMKSKSPQPSKSNSGRPWSGRPSDRKYYKNNPKSEEKEEEKKNAASECKKIENEKPSKKIENEKPRTSNQQRITKEKITSSIKMLHPEAIHDINDISVWNTAKKVNCSEDGSGGVFIVTTKEDKKIVVKSTPTQVQELFAFLLAYKIGAPSPMVRTIEFSTNEWGELRDRLNMMTITHPIKRKIQKELERGFYMVMEYVEGVSLAAAGSIKLKELLTPAALHQIGIVVALDMYVNNWDRFPFIWDNDGNMENILIQSDGKNVLAVAIDHPGTCIPSNNKVGFDKYMKKLADSLDLLIKDPKTVTSNTKKIKESIEMWSGHDIEDEGSLIVQKGIIEGCHKLSQFSHEEVMGIVTQIKNMITQDISNIWGKMISLMFPDYLQSVGDIFRSRSKQLAQCL